MRNRAARPFLGIHCCNPAATFRYPGRPTTPPPFRQRPARQRFGRKQAAPAEFLGRFEGRSKPELGGPIVAGEPIVILLKSLDQCPPHIEPRHPKLRFQFGGAPQVGEGFFVSTQDHGQPPREGAKTGSWNHPLL